MNYSKQALSFVDQVTMLKSRWLTIQDDNLAIEYLKSISYFRLVGYLRPMEADKINHIYKKGSSFENALSLYKFDTTLRSIVFKAIQDIEIAMRTKIIHYFSLTSGPFWFMEKKCADKPGLFAKNLNNIDEEVVRSKEEFIKEHFQKYSYPTLPPAWKTLEVLSFGTLSKLYLNYSDKKTKKIIARELGLPQHVFLESWMRSLAVLRNFCAHHARLWNRNFPFQPQMPQRLSGKWVNTSGLQLTKIYPQLCVLAYLLNQFQNSCSFTNDLKELLAKYSNVDTAAMGFPKGWQNEPLWK